MFILISKSACGKFCWKIFCVFVDILVSNLLLIITITRTVFCYFDGRYFNHTVNTTIHLCAFNSFDSCRWHCAYIEIQNYSCVIVDFKLVWVCDVMCECMRMSLFTRFSLVVVSNAWLVSSTYVCVLCMYYIFHNLYYPYIDIWTLFLWNNS